MINARYSDAWLLWQAQRCLPVSYRNRSDREVLHSVVPDDTAGPGYATMAFAKAEASALRSSM